MKKKIALILALGMLAGSIAGCGNPGGQDTGDSSGAGDNRTSEKTGSNSEGNNESTPAASSKDTVVIATAVEPIYFFMQQEPATAASLGQDAIVLYNIYDYLFNLDESGALEPSIGLEYTIENDGLTYVVKIRDDAYFTNGDKVTAEDVAFSYNLVFENIPANARGLLTGLESAEARDETTVQFNMSTKFAAFPNCWTTRAAPIISKTYYEEVGADGYQAAPLGSGPYTLGEVVSGESLTMHANEDYWGGAPAIKNVIVRPISNVNTQFVALQSGEVDVILNANLASCLQLDPNVASWAYCDSATRALMLMQSNPASGSQMVDENLRKAIACCVNREDLVIGVCEGYGSPSWYDTVPSYLGAPALEDCTLAAEYDLDKAKEYLEASNYDGSPLSIYCNSGSRAEQAANIIQGAMIAAGINAEVKAVDGGTSSAAMASGEYDMLIAESTGSQFDTGCLGNIYTTPSFAQMMSDEAFAWMDEKIQAQRQETDPEARKALTAEILSYMNENTISVPLYLPAATIAFNKDLKGVVAHPQTITHLQDWSW